MWLLVIKIVYTSCLLICCIVFLRLVFLIRLDDSYTLFLQERKTIGDNGLIRKIKLTSKFMTSQSCLQTIAMHILFYILQSEDNQQMKFG